MRVSLFGLFLRCTSLMEPWPKPVQSELLILGFISDFLFYDDYVISVHTCYTCIHICARPGSPLGFCLPLAWGVSSDSPGSSCPGHGAWSMWISPSCWSEWRSGSVDLQQTVQSLILPGLLCASRVFLFVNSWVPLYYSFLYISLYSRICAILVM